jgi:hypothetical protein
MKRLWIGPVISVLLIMSGAGGLITVFWLLPYMVRPYDNHWLVRRSELGRWEFTQNYIRRFGWRHDDSGPVGAHGGKEWAAWIMDRVRDGPDPRGCESGHKTTALKSITNHSPVDDTRRFVPWEEERPGWLAWWRQNRHKSQDEWIVDGFRSVGVMIHNPPAKEDWPALLTILGRGYGKGGEPPPDGIQKPPRHLSFNAFRCLRDSGFDPVAHALESEITPEIKAGLLAYQQRDRSSGTRIGRPDGLFGARDSEYIALLVPDVITPPFRWGWGSASVATCLAGVWMWCRMRRRNARNARSRTQRPPTS